ncbi:MAG TPA: nucleotide-binding domain containing protein, partial [Candidatus Limnocylindria bacterium]|nr:nucleotide-binding domain containing protein [Candidatus Limnocylindria bacterium]
GSAGLAKHMLSHWPAPAAAHQPEQVPARPGGRVLVVAGSVHPSALAQLDRMRGAPGFAVFDDAGEAAHAVLRDPENLPRTIVLTAAPAPGERPAPSGGFSEHLGRIAKEIFGPLGAGALVLTGGETAYAVLDARGMHEIELEEAPLEGAAAGWAQGVLVVTKTGGFGDRDALHALAGYAAEKLGAPR